VAKHFGWDMPFWVTAGLCFPGALAWLVIDPEQLRPTPKHEWSIREIFKEEK
jgi:hypothetical protein